MPKYVEATAFVKYMYLTVKLFEVVAKYGRVIFCRTTTMPDTVSPGELTVYVVDDDTEQAPTVDVHAVPIVNPVGIVMIRDVLEAVRLLSRVNGAVITRLTLEGVSTAMF